MNAEIIFQKLEKSASGHVLNLPLLGAKTPAVSL